MSDRRVMDIARNVGAYRKTTSVAGILPPARPSLRTPTGLERERYGAAASDVLTHATFGFRVEGLLASLGGPAKQVVDLKGG